MAKSIRLQAALDHYTLTEALQCAEQLSGQVDIIEVGTPLIINCGLEAVAELRRIFPQLPLTADLKIMDGAYGSVKRAFAAGADTVTVLGAAADETVKESVRAAKESGGRIMIDLINVANPGRRAREIAALGADIVLLHIPYDAVLQGAGWEHSHTAGLPPEIELAVAGGISEQTLADVLTLQPSIVIIGSAIYKAADPRAAAAAIKARLLSLAEKR